MSEMRVPTEADWRSERWNIDTPDAYRSFFGKDRREAFEMFKVGSSRKYAEDVAHMPLVCFHYYLHAYIDHLLSEKSADDSSGAYAFFWVVTCRSDDIKRDAGLRSRVTDALVRLRDGQQWYGAKPEIYDDYAECADEALSTVREIPV